MSYLFWSTLFVWSWAAEIPDRLIIPAVTPPEVFLPPEPESFDIGLVHVHLLTMPGSRKVEIRYVVGRGSLDLAPGPSSATDLLFELQGAATQDRSPEQLSSLIADRDLTISSWGDLHDSGVAITAPRQELALALEVGSEVLFEPLFIRSELKRKIREVQQWFQGRALQSTAPIATQALLYGWFPESSPYGRRPDLAVLSSLKVRELEILHQQLVSDASLDVWVIGDCTRDELEPLLSPLVVGRGSQKARLSGPPDAARESRMIAIDLNGVAQSAIRVRTLAPVSGSQDEAAMQILDFATGGSFLSRLNANLREDKGLTYGAGSTYTRNLDRAYWTAWVDVPSEHTVTAIQEIETELSQVADTGITERERLAARNSAVSEWNSIGRNASTAVGTYLGAFYDQATISEYYAYFSSLDQVNLNEIQSVASKYWGQNKTRLWVVVGDRDELEPQFEDAGLKVEWITIEEAVYGNFR